MVEDDLDRFDLELTILSDQIVRRQRDQNTGQWKYCVRGYSVNGDDAEVVVKIGPTDKVVFITVYKP